MSLPAAELYHLCRPVSLYGISAVVVRRSRRLLVAELYGSVKDDFSRRLLHAKGRAPGRSPTG